MAACARGRSGVEASRLHETHPSLRSRHASFGPVSRLDPSVTNAQDPSAPAGAAAWWRTPRAAWALLGALTLFGLSLRLTGLSFLLPHAWEPDSLVFVRQTEYLASGAGEAHKDVFYGYYPHLIPRLCTLLPRAPLDHTPASLPEHLAAAAASRVHIRHLIAFLSVLIVPGTWFLARRFLSRSGALFASGMMAASVLHIWFAQQTRPHGLSSVFALFAVVAALRLRTRGDLSSYLLAGGAAILAIGSLQSGIAVLVPLGVAHLLRNTDGTRRPHLIFALVLVLIGASIPIFYPFMFEASSGHDAAVIDVEGDRLNLSGHGIQLSAFDGRGFSTVLNALANYELILFVLLVLGAGWLALRFFGRPVAERRARTAGWRARIVGREDLCVVFAYVVPYFLVIGLYAHTYQRFAIPLLPFIACFTSWTLFTVCHRVVAARGFVRGGEAMAFLISIVLFLGQALSAVKLVTIRTQPDTSARAARWIAEHLMPGRDRIALSPSLDRPLFRTPEALAAFPPENERTFPWIVYQRQLEPAVSARIAYDVRPIPVQSTAARAALVTDEGAYVSSLRAEYVVIEHFTSNLRPYNERLRIGLQERGRLVARFSPMWVDTGDDLPLAYQDDDFERRGTWWARVLLARSMGPVIEIYRLSP